MTKKDFELVASVIASYPDFSPSLRTSKVSFAASFAKRFTQVNPRFDVTIFAKACGLAVHEQGGIVHPNDWCAEVLA